MGAGDARYLAKASVVTMAVYLPFAAVLWWCAASGRIGGADPLGLALLWAAFTAVFLGARAITLWWRTRTPDWMHLERSVDAAPTA